MHLIGNYEFWAAGVGQVVEHLPSKCRALVQSSIPPKKKKKRKEIS
jgi:hypothetical protein